MVNVCEKCNWNIEVQLKFKVQVLLKMPFAAKFLIYIYVVNAV